MKRRTVLKSLAAALMCPNITLRKSVPDERLLAAFCLPEEYRHDFRSPFGIDSLTYATDNRAIVRCELESRVEDGTRRLPKDVLKVWDHHWTPQQQWKPLTPDDLRPTIHGSYGDECPLCGSEATVSLDDEYPDSEKPWVNEMLRLHGYDVDTNSVRDKNCPECHGLYYNKPGLAVICGVPHSAFRLRRILELPGVQVCQSMSVPEALLFRSDGFEGISLGVVE